MPAAATNRLSTEVLAILDGQIFTPSALPLERRQELDAAFRRLKMPRGESASYQLAFRKSDVVGANALALPSGTIVVTDDLVALAEDDRELIGVLAHEAGHVDHRHGLRNMLQNSMVGLLVAWFIGDISSIPPQRRRRFSKRVTRAASARPMATRWRCSRRMAFR